VRFVCETSSTLTAARLVELGTGCAFLDPFVARSLTSGSVVTCRANPAFGHSYGVFAPQSLPLSDEAGQALDFIREVAAEFS
jgi:DNA-binding transcriptional LysR family regulator